MSNAVIVDGIEVYENDITRYLDQYIAEKRIPDMRKEPQSRWNACLLYIYKYVFKDNRDKLMYKNNRDTYNDKLINNICDIYIDLCYEYDKEVSIMGFSKLTGINPDTVYSWGNEEYRLGSSSPEIYKKLNLENEESLSGMLISGGRNPMKILPALNRRHNWNMGQPRGVDGAIKHRTADQIAADYTQLLEIKRN